MGETDFDKILGVLAARGFVFERQERADRILLVFREAGVELAFDRALGRLYSVSALSILEQVLPATLQTAATSQANIPECAMCGTPLPTDAVVRNGNAFCAACGIR